MRLKILKALKILVLVMFMILGVLSNDIPTQPNGVTCPSDRFLFKTGSDPTSLKDRCVLKSKQQLDCFYYTFDSLSDCKCDTAKGFTIQKVKGLKQKGCVPARQMVLNCQQYVYSYGNYQCDKCPQLALTIIPYLDAQGNTLRGCGTQVQGCMNHTIFDNTFQIDGDPFGGKVIGCKTCFYGRQEYSSSSSNKFLWYGKQNNGVGCPTNKQWRNCNLMYFEFSSYKCKCSSPQLSMYYYTSLTTPPIKTECLDSTDINIDTNCQYYGINSLGQAFCSQCKMPSIQTFLLPSFVDNKLKIYCSDPKQDGCQIYKSQKEDIITAKSSQLFCGACNQDTHFQIFNKQYKIDNGDFTQKFSLYTCLPKDRYINHQSCQYYQEVNPDQDLSIKCQTCKFDPSNNKPPCYLYIPQKAGNCSNGQLSAKLSKDNKEICIINGIIDNCQFYTSFDPATSTATGCSQCKAGSTLATTTASTTTKFCIPDSLLIPNCDQYQNKDFSCATCKSGFIYDSQTKTCVNDPNSPIPTKPQTPPNEVPKILNCHKAIQIGTTPYCISCSTGFTSVNSKCIASVPGCSTFNINGACTSCVPTYQLINGKCIPIPEHCLTVNQKRDCTQCQTGYLINSEKGCSESTINTCPAGYVPSADGNCVIVKKPIADCVRYTKNSKCEECAEGYEPANNNLRCIRSVTSAMNDILKVKPCPPDTNKYSYRRNPSDPYGECVKVDLNCLSARDDGHCIGCNEGYFAHVDGLCYRLIYNN